MGLTFLFLLSLFSNYCVIIVILRRWVVDSLKPDSKTDKRPFAEKHPKLNFLFGLLLLLFLIIVFGYAMYMIGKYISIGVNAAANWLASLASKLDAVVIVTLITGCVSIVSVLISSVVAKRIEYKRSRQEYLAKKREVPYGQFVDMVYKIQQNTKKDGSYTEAQMLEDLSQFSKQITLWGSSRVVNKWVKFRENSANPELAQKNLLLLEDIMNEMRKDLGLRKAKKETFLLSFSTILRRLLNQRNSFRWEFRPVFLIFTALLCEFLPNSLLTFPCRYITMKIPIR